MLNLSPWQRSAATRLTSTVHEVLVGNFYTPAELVAELIEISDRITQDHSGILSADDPLSFNPPWTEVELGDD